MNGLLLIIFVTTKSMRAWLWRTLRLDRHPLLHRVISVFITSNLIAFTWIFFRAKNINDALTIIQRIFSGSTFSGFANLHANIDGSQLLVSLVLIAGLFAVERFGGNKALWKSVDGTPSWLRWSAYYLFALVLIVLILTNPAQKAQQFIYFQF